MMPIACDVERLTAVCVRYGIARLDVFGSTVVGTDGPDSDVDLLYTLAPGARLGWAIEDLAQELSEIFGRPVDLVSRSTLNPHLRDAVLAEARPFYAAQLPTASGLTTDSPRIPHEEGPACEG